MHLKTSNRTASRARPVTVHFPLPRNAVSKLRALAVGKDPRLLDLGVLAVQISDDESIVLGIELDKAKKKTPVYVNKAEPSSFSHLSHERVSLNTKPTYTDVGGFTTTSTFGSTSYNYKGVYTSQHLSTARNDNFVSKAKKPAQNAKRRAKETLNAAKRGRGKGRAGKTSGQKSASARVSTWEMVYSHIGLPGERRNKATNPLEPPVGSQASGIAHVPVAQTELPREGTSKTDSKRKSLVSSPPLKSPCSYGAANSDDDSSVSSSPCSHSPMNSEELMNLFVDSTFSATSVLKQLAEIRSKVEEKQSDFENDSDKMVANTSIEAGVDGQAKMNEPGSSTMAETVFDSQCQWGIFPKASGTPLPKMENDNYITNPKKKKSSRAVGKGPTISSSSGVRPNQSKLNSTSTTSSLIGNSTSIKRSASSSGEQYSSHLSSTASLPSSKSIVINPQPSKRAKTELSRKRDKVKLSKKSESSKSPDPLTLPVNTNSLQFGTSSLFPSNNQIGNLSTTAVTTANVALRNYLQYGYYYSSEELSRALAKTPSIKNKGTLLGQQILHTSASSSSKLDLSLSENSNGTSTLPKPEPQDEQLSLKEPASSLLSPSSLSHDSLDLSHQADNFSKIEAVSKTSSDIPKMEKSTTLPTDLNRNPPSPSTRVSMSKNNKCEVNALSLTSSTSGIPTMITATTSSSTVLTSSDSTPPNGTVVDQSSIQKSGKCYAISYVYPMGTVWYPYVAITPYAVLQKNEAESNDTEKKETEGQENSAFNTSSQYIDLASSLRYWQQLSLLYKNQMLATVSANPNVLGQTLDQNTGTKAPGFLNSAASNISSDLSKQSLAFSMMDPKSKRAKDSFSFSESCTDNQPSQDLALNPNGPFEKKTVRRPSVIVAAKTSSNIDEETSQHRSSRSTPESDSSTDGMQMKTEALVIDNCNRLIEEHCHRMNQVLADTPGSYSIGHTENTKSSSTTPLLSFIPDSSIAYVNVGNNNGSKKTAGNSKDVKSKPSKKKKSNKAL